MGVRLATVRRLALALPGVEEGTSYGTPAWRVRKKLLARMREDDSLVVASTWEERAELCESSPDVFHFTDHYANYEYVLVRLPAVTKPVLASVLESAWRRLASKKMLAEYDAS